MFVDQGEKLASCTSVVPKYSGGRACGGHCTGFFYTSHAHAHVAAHKIWLPNKKEIAPAFHDNSTAQGINGIHNSLQLGWSSLHKVNTFGDLARKTLLNLKAARKDLNNASDLAQPQNLR